MKNKPQLILGITLMTFAGFSCSQTKKETTTTDNPSTPTTETVTTNDLPNLPFTKLDGTKQIAKELKGKVMLVFFHPDCDHCQREITQIRENITAFKNHQIYFFSDAQLPLISKFAQDYKVSAEPNFTFGRTETIDVLNSVGPIATPSVYIYAENGKLVKAFNGETPIENILQFM